MKNVIILAAGNSTRFKENKLLTRFDGMTLIEHAIIFAFDNGAKNIHITLNPKHCQIHNNELFHPIMKELSHWNNLNIKYKFQNTNEYGPAAAIKVWEEELKEESFLVLFGDNFYQGKLKLYPQNNNIVSIKELKQSQRNLQYAYIDPYGRIIEKPHNHTYGRFFCGFIYFQREVWNKMKSMKPSKRGELEISKLFNRMANKTTYDIGNIKWTDITYQKDIKKVNKLLRS